MFKHPDVLRREEMRHILKSEGREWRHDSDKQTRMAEDLKLSSGEKASVPKKPFWNENFAYTFPLFLSEHTLMCESYGVSIICLPFYVRTSQKFGTSPLGLAKSIFYFITFDICYFEPLLHFSFRFFCDRSARARVCTSWRAQRVSNFLHTTANNMQVRALWGRQQYRNVGESVPLTKYCLRRQFLNRFDDIYTLRSGAHIFLIVSVNIRS